MFKGYKCFDKGVINRYGTRFEIGKIYHCDNTIKFGNNGHGFHVCKRLEDTLRYFDAMNEEIDMAKVTCYGNYQEYEDDYNEYYDMYAFEYMIIDEIMSREAIITYGLKLSEIRVKRFISQIKLTTEEIMLFKEKFKYNDNVLKTISYYQEGNEEAYNTYTKVRKL